MECRTLRDVRIPDSRNPYVSRKNSRMPLRQNVIPRFRPARTVQTLGKLRPRQTFVRHGYAIFRMVPRMMTGRSHVRTEERGFRADMGQFCEIAQSPGTRNSGGFFPSNDVSRDPPALPRCGIWQNPPLRARPAHESTGFAGRLWAHRKNMRTENRLRRSGRDIAEIGGTRVPNGCRRVLSAKSGGGTRIPNERGRTDGRTRRRHRPSRPLRHGNIGGLRIPAQ